MKRRAYAKRRDENEPHIVRAALDWASAREIAISIERLDADDPGLPDLLIGLVGTNLLVEVKNPDALAGRGKLSPEQVAWHAAWPGQATTVWTAEDMRRVLDAALEAKAA